MVENRVERRLAAIFAGDVAGYSRLMGADDEGTLDQLKAHRRELIDPKIAEHRGRIVKTTGDGILVEFVSVVDGLRCAVEIQRGMIERNANIPNDKRIQLRIGINVGDIIIDSDDIFGDGVNVAARLEALADPGGIMISSIVHDQVRDRLPYRFHDLGEKSIKNIARPVRVFRVDYSEDSVPATEFLPAWSARHTAQHRRRLGASLAAAALAIIATMAWWQPWVHREVPAPMARMTPSLPGKPSIAVLPFTNMSADPQQDYFADGMAEDVITDLSKIPGLFVIARNSTFTYKGKSVKIQQVAEELGVRYVLEGSVQRAGERVRINAQLIDATTGGHLWAERYDGSMADIFGLQDKVTQKIVTALALNLTAKVPGSREKTAIPQAYDAFLKGWELYRRFSPDDFSKAIPYFERAVQLDQNYGRAYAALATIYWESWRQGESWTSKVNPADLNYQAFMGARYKAEKYIELALKNPTPLAHRVASAMDWDYRKFDEAIAEAETALTLEPNDPDGHVALAWALIFNGRPQEAVPLVERAIRLDPLHPEIYAFVLGVSRLGMGQSEEAVTLLERARTRSAQDRDVNLLLTVAYERLGRHEEAHVALQRYTAVWSMFSSAYVDDIMSWWPFKRESDIRRFGASLIAAGLCCADRLEHYIEIVRQGGTLK
jgi:adenylate cyclase